MNNFKWVYQKDGSGSGGADCAWLDDIIFPTPVVLSVWAGSDQEVCADDEAYLGAEPTNYTLLEWESSGNGTFDDETIPDAVYTPGPDDLTNGSVMLTVSVWDSENNIQTDELTIFFIQEPDTPATPQGPSAISVPLTNSSLYTTEGVDGTDQYQWYISPEEAGSISGDNLKGIVNWNPDFAGIAYISVSGINNCGEGIVSEEYEVEVDNLVAVPEQANPDIEVMVLPNPSNGNFFIEMNTTSQETINLKIFNLLGAIVYEKSIMPAGTNNTEIRLNGIVPGVYVVLLENTNVSINKKIIIQ